MRIFFPAGLLRFFSGIFLFLFTASAATASGPAPPKREVRAVWIATVLGLDWPKSADREEQERSLREMIRKLAAAHFNTIFFQVRGRADAMYRSDYEPWSPQLTGTLGKDPGWDPLAVVLEEAHARCMEVHAWFNTVMVKNGGGPPAESSPRHLILAHPDWIHEVNGEWWLDPGIPDARRYLINVAMDLVRKYDIDGFQFDFLRYPVQEFPDQTTYRHYGRSVPKDEWRRDNINAIARQFRDSALAVRPRLKIGSSPIGIYRNTSGFRGLQSYTDLYQDSRRWILEGWQDYLAPQLYWPLGGGSGDPDFALVLRDWSEHAGGRHLYPGIGAYKPAVFPDIPRLIDLSREEGMQGNSFFRYSNIEDFLAMGGRYPAPALIPPMLWRDSVPPLPPADLRVRTMNDGIVVLRWSTPLPAADGELPAAYVVYRSPDGEPDRTRPGNIVAILPPVRHSYLDTIRENGRAGYSYSVTAVDRLWNESLPGKERLPVSELAVISRVFRDSGVVKEPFQPAGSSTVYFPYELVRVTPVILRILDQRNREVASVVDAVELPGRHIAAADVSGLHSGRYTSLCIFDDRTVKIPFDVR
ncbi:MAG TPA: family 10 glycosylhydrolase [Bacteroidota bacterium]|nr:family 10 glycosylhydrolase [Bacteroidota bacterium]